MARETKLTSENIKKAAVLAAAGRSTADIEIALHVSQPTVSRLLRLARDRRYLETRCTLPVSQIREIESLLHVGKALTKHPAWSKRLIDVKIVSNTPPAGARPSTTTQWRAFAAGAADHVLTLLPRATQIGVTWGRVLQGLVDVIEQQMRERPPFEDAVVFPVCGDPPQIARAPERSSSLLAARLQRAVGDHSEGHSNSLVGVTAFIPETFTDSEVATLRKALTFTPGYVSIFSKRGLASRMDCLLTGIGTSSDLHDPLAGSHARSDGRAVRERASLGNIGGVLLERTGATRADLQRLRDQNDRWTGLKSEHLERCARHGASRKVPGTIVVATGADKATVLDAAIRRGWVNHAVIDPPLAAKLSQLSREA
jgi:DNA-binding transcriptional regulator LsrR (DeoR family)